MSARRLRSRWNAAILVIALVCVWLSPVIAIVLSIGAFAASPGRRPVQVALLMTALVAGGWLFILASMEVAVGGPAR